MKRITAIQYLRANSKYDNEWTGAGMWEAVEEVLASPNKKLTYKFLDELLKKAEDF